MSKTQCKSRSEELLTKVGLDEKDWNRQLRKFSKGMLQRVGLAQSLINEPEIVFLDEPMSGLDPMGRREIRELIESLRANGTTVFMSTHILSDIEALCDRVAIMRRGKLSATGTLDELLANESQQFEINVKGISGELISANLPDVDFQLKPQGANIYVSSEDEIESILAAVKKSGGKLVSIQPVKQSLEELFVQDAKS